ncbi:glucose-6-phosphate dehydrogenase assembly protein OpcA [Aetokthonos hydrillicola Thurmond2011]|jgi:glucose-6-phosphate dehydrogenase assembly protein OpcA|uniref:Glucose-6-phosphate dehydrogenase assembly protein OpcA n=1 Tax=Aetokthonos hydrillicola Thurmond2011 TaxID=2712845 RepID=A0AAP5ICU2_9CYAN|nr:glucose-6-phosphate dehydrogenase assembly protein OpcA [Aetokthonos hydrillicola]MBO3461283.1 glucose-6-phosphate dehydrogenase assembly protein OpcA [Aetokthonos hydrillicola CCALA 1050]MBW4589622.1 glucose-6-phosphate dehydrogenase assembly protein OpcA [Aetokthonos hydrillicola CCALA 1050]MDR9899116.1 glucose-6-phosphate dehydrogenase assembly protein OpcA [Aetokthonos hydrillicola Thurmond2011]
MTSQAPTIFSLQAPKDISLTEIETELSQIWQSYGITGDDGTLPAATRATTFTLIVYEPEETQSLLATLGYYHGPIDGILGPQTVAAVQEAQKALGLEPTGKVNPEMVARLREELAKRYNSGKTTDNSSGSVTYSAEASSPRIADEIALRNPCRIITLSPIAGEDEGVKAQVSAYCPIQKHSSSTLVCCEYITLTGTAIALERIGGMIPALLIGGLPKFLWWKATPDPNNALFKRLASVCNNVIVDSCNFNTPDTDLLSLQELIESGVPLADLNWRRLSGWQELTAEAYDPPQRRTGLQEVDRVNIDYEKGNPVQALMFVSWLASRLNWQPVSYQKENGDYEITRIQFVAQDQKQIEAELAGVPVGDVGEVSGDLIALRLNSTNPQANAGTLICSETGGCMRMETQGGAQSSGVYQQVTSLSEQKAEALLSQQVQRWGREALFEESLAVATKVINLGAKS